MTRMIRYIQKRWLLWSVGLLLPAFASFVMNYGLALGLKAYTAELSGNNRDFQRVVVLMSVTAFVLVVASLTEDITRYLFSVFLLKTERDIRQELYESVVYAEYSKLNRIDREGIYLNYFKDVEGATSLITGDLFAVLFPLVHTVGYAIALFQIHFLIGALVLGMTGSVMLLNWFFTNRFRELKREELLTEEQFTRMMDATVRGKMTIRQLQIGERITEQIADRAEEIYLWKKKKIRWKSYRKLSLELISMICTSLMVPVACILAVFHKIAFPSVVVVAQICRLIMIQTNGLGIAIQQFGTNRISYARIQKLLELPKEPDIQKDKLDEMDWRKPAIKLKQFGITYQNKVIIREADIKIESGKITALVGPSGSGKTSLVYALMGFIKYRGEMEFYGVKQKDISLSAVRKLISYCPEHGQLFEEESVWDNLCYAAGKNRSQAEIEKVLKGLFCSEIDWKQKAGNLSVGQRQRIALARAFLKDSEIFILDEPTAAQDKESEGRILQAIAGLKRQGKTVIVISHRKSTIEIADSVYMVSEQKIVRLPFTSACQVC